MEEIGRGATSIVYKAVNDSSGQDVCIKVIEKTSLETEDDMKFFRTEISVLSTLIHKNIIKYYELVEDTKYYYLVQEYCPGDSLQTYIERFGVLSDRFIEIVFRQVLSALKYMHAAGVAHRDIKPDNIMIGPNMLVKIIDFGLSTEDNSKLRTTFCGSLAFAAPECIMREPYSAWRSDIWSAGIVLYMMAAGKLPWKTNNLVILMKNITNGVLPMPIEISPNIRNMLIAMLKPDPTQRPSAEQLFGMEICGDQVPKDRAPRASQIYRVSSNPTIRLARQNPSPPLNGRAIATPRVSHKPRVAAPACPRNVAPRIRSSSYEGPLSRPVTMGGARSNGNSILMAGN